LPLRGFGKSETVHLDGEPDFPLGACHGGHARMIRKGDTHYLTNKSIAIC